MNALSFLIAVAQDYGIASLLGTLVSAGAFAGSLVVMIARLAL